MKPFFVLAFLFVLASGSNAQVRSLNLEEFLNDVQKNNKSFQSLKVNLEASAEKRTSGDRELIPVFTLKNTIFSDQKTPSMLGSTEMKSTQYSLGFLKKFSTGTALNLSANMSGYENLGMNPSSTLSSIYGKYAQGAVGVSLSQSLWKDFFGRATDLRKKREDLYYNIEKFTLDFQYRKYLIEAENAFWDYLYLKEENSIRESSLQRAKKIESWFLQRVQDGVSDQTDLLSAKALVANRELQFSSSQDELTAIERKVRDILELKQSENFPILNEDLYRTRAIFNPKEESESVDFIISQLQAKARHWEAQETQEQLKSDLNLSASYNTNSYEPSGSVMDSSRSWLQTDKPTASVVITWTYLLDTEVKDSMLSASQKSALASQIQSERKHIDSLASWDELLRRYSELTKKIAIAESIKKIQLQRAKSEQEKLSKGRTITATVINSEQDAAEASLMLIKLQVEHRKLESQSRLFEPVESILDKEIL
ncbi:MAG TPA: TolC family protein [Pseudobdellovibrionaceae bacterium]|nr:TolC family protein [Pseudobdellovibrionaceae bacterium]